MLNYIKSEFYRVFHGKEVYVITLTLSGLLLAMNLALFAFDRLTPNFPYAIVRFSMNTLTSSMSFLFIAALIIVGFLFSDEYKNGTMKNVFAFGISRKSFFTGKCIVCGTMALASMTVILAVYVGSTYLLLNEPESLPLEQLLKGIVSTLPAAFAALILAVALFCIFKKEGTAVLCWLGIIWGIPTACFFLGLKINWIGKVASWLPWNYLNHEVQVTWSDYQCLWNTAEGLTKSIIAGVIGMIVFYTAGVICLKRRDIA